jgi:hypothetical protein
MIGMTPPPSMNADAPQGIYARVANQVFHSVEAVAEASRLEGSLRRPGRENHVDRNAAGFSPSRFPVSNFCFRPKFPDARNPPTL